MKNNTSKDLARYIDHAVLNPELTKQDIIEKINIGVQYHCQTVCVNPSAIFLKLIWFPIMDSSKSKLINKSLMKSNK